MHRLLVACVIALSCAATLCAQDVQRTYRIGNSLTWDSQPKAIPDLAAQRGIKHLEAYHINCGKSLQRIWTHPDEVCVKVVEPFGTFGQALPDHDWDAVTMQSHPGKESTLATDTARILDFIELTQSKGRNKNTVFYIYAPWPREDRGDYQEVWHRDTPDADDTKTIQTKAYFDHLYHRVTAKTKATVRVIPTGAVIAELDQRIRDGKIEGYTEVKDLYRDIVHLNGVGRFAAGVTTYTVLFNQNPAGLVCPPKQYGGPQQFNEALYQAIEDAVWKVVTDMHEQTGVKPTS
ncbi:hypothetical protein HED60_03845 [Planctomycetales bacterium ZRK34]|nr:hypothetical protein HED60_03845 [Planctomycetales bacterium ZRK34]